MQVTNARKFRNSFRDMVSLQDGGDLLCPSNECIHIVSMGVALFELSTVSSKKKRGKFHVAYSSENFYVQVYQE